MKYKILLFVILLSPLTVFAQCHLDGQYYDEGSQVGGYTCNAGQWV